MERQEPKFSVEETLTAGMGEVIEQGHEAANKLGDAIANARAKIQEKTVAGAKATDRVIRAHPYETIGIAFGLGVLVGVLLNRR